MSRSLKLPSVERKIAIEEVIQAIEDGSLTEAFGTGTAASISPIGFLIYRGKTIKIGNTGPITQYFFDMLTGIQEGRIQDPNNWVKEV